MEKGSISKHLTFEHDSNESRGFRNLISCYVFTQHLCFPAQITQPSLMMTANQLKYVHVLIHQHVFPQK